MCVSRMDPVFAQRTSEGEKVVHRTDRQPACFWGGFCIIIFVRVIIPY